MGGTAVVLALVMTGCGTDPWGSAEERTAPPQGEGAEAAHVAGVARTPSFVPMEAIVKFRQRAEAVTAAQVPGVRELEELGQGTRLVRFEPAAKSDEPDRDVATLALIQQLRARDDVEYAHPNWIFEFSRVPNDPSYPDQWHFPAIRLPAAWDLTTGSSATRIAILDTGRTGHPELSARWVPGLEYDAVGQDGNAQTDASTTWRHGIHVAGIAGGASNNGQGTAGVCWSCQLLNVKVGQGDDGANAAAVIRGITWAVNNGAQVLNLSFESNGLPCSHADRTALRDAVAYAIDRNVTVVAAAGNQASNAANTVPASCPGVISVAATDRGNRLAPYSNRDAVTLAAPGGGGVLTPGGNGYGAGLGCPADAPSGFTPSTEGALATWTTSNNGHCYRYLSGTSMAAPHVAGVVGLMLSRNPSLSPAQVRQILQSTAQPVKCAQNGCGAGLLDAAAAVQQAAPLPINDAPPVASFTMQCSGLDCTFDGRGSSDDRGIVAYQWSLPGQQVRTGSTATFFMPGYVSQNVRLRVTDSAGQSTEVVRTVAPGQPAVAPIAGVFYNPARSGNGIDLYETSVGGWLLYWYTYEADGSPIWYFSGNGPMSGARWTQPLYKATWNGSTATTVPVGTVSLDVSSPGALWFSWVLNGVPGGERFVYLAGGQGRSGVWYVPMQSGWGINVQESGSSLDATVTFYHQGSPRWMNGPAPAPGSNVTIPLTYYEGPGLCPSCGGSTPREPNLNWGGSMNLRILDGAATIGQASTDITHFGPPILPIWVRPLQSISLLTKP
jgi:subtilisin family serine protease